MQSGPLRTLCAVCETPVNKVHEGQPHIVDMMKNDEIALVVNTVQEKRSAIQDSSGANTRSDGLCAR